MPVREVRSSGRNLTGRVHDHTREAHKVESTLERDLLVILRFDLNVDRFEAQPVRIDYTDAHGTSRHYTPDLLVTYRKDITPANTMPPVLCEVKYASDLARNAEAYAAKFAAAHAYAAERGWTFRTFDETQIRTPYLDNARFLFAYWALSPDQTRKRLVLETINRLSPTTPAAVLEALFKAHENRALLLPVLWWLVARRRVGADLAQKLTMNSPIWSTQPHTARHA
jgi:hypothetical protein